MINRINKPILLVLSLLVIVIGLVRWDEARLKKYETTASFIGIKKAVEDCEKSGVDQSVCRSINGEVSQIEIHGRPGWNVYASSEDSETYRASMIITHVNNNFEIVDFVRDTP